MYHRVKLSLTTSDNNIIASYRHKFPNLFIGFKVYSEIIEMQESINSLLKSHGLKKEILKDPVTEEHRNMIAQKIGGQWESLATFIGVCHEEVEDIKETKKEPLDRRLAMMRRWKKLYGMEATYLKLVESLMHVGRRDLADNIIMEISQENRKKLEETWRYYFLIMTLFVLFLASALLVYNNIYYYKNTNIMMMSENVTENNKTSSDQFIEADLVHTLSNHANKSCSRTLLTDGSLPMHDKEIFVDREIDIPEVMSSVAMAELIL